jgi:hypothetical protein
VVRLHVPEPFRSCRTTASPPGFQPGNRGFDSPHEHHLSHRLVGLGSWTLYPGTLVRIRLRVLVCSGASPPRPAACPHGLCRGSYPTGDGRMCGRMGYAHCIRPPPLGVRRSFAPHFFSCRPTVGPRTLNPAIVVQIHAGDPCLARSMAEHPVEARTIVVRFHGQAPLAFMKSPWQVTRMVRDPAVNRAVREHHAGSSPALSDFRIWPIRLRRQPRFARCPALPGGSSLWSGGLAPPRQRACGAAPLFTSTSQPHCHIDV